MHMYMFVWVHVSTVCLILKQSLNRCNSKVHTHMFFSRNVQPSRQWLRDDSVGWVSFFQKTKERGLASSYREYLNSCSCM